MKPGSGMDGSGEWFDDVVIGDAFSRSITVTETPLPLANDRKAKPTAAAAQALAQQADAPWHRAGLNYLSALLGQPGCPARHPDAHRVGNPGAPKPAHP